MWEPRLALASPPRSFGMAFASPADDGPEAALISYAFIADRVRQSRSRPPSFQSRACFSLCGDFEPSARRTPTRRHSKLIQQKKQTQRQFRRPSLSRPFQFRPLYRQRPRIEPPADQQITVPKNLRLNAPPRRDSATHRKTYGGQRGEIPRAVLRASAAVGARRAPAWRSQTDRQSLLTRSVQNSLTQPFTRFTHRP
jgi:hypothetical protein